MPSFSQDITDNRIIITVAIRIGPEAETSLYRALLDTGAQVTAISPRVVQQLGLIPTGTLKLTVASGQEVEVFQYHARVDIPIQYNMAHPPGARPFLMGDQRFVVGLPYVPEGYDVLLGMDFIGMFHMTIFRNMLILSN